MKNSILLFILYLLPILAFTQGKFEGRGVYGSSQKILDLSYENLSSVPISANDSDIEILILDNNNITELPNWIGQLKNLKVLSVRNNKLTEFNYSLNSLENLEQLYLSGNKRLNDLPALSACEKLLIIDVVETQINYVPGWVQTNNNIFYFKYSDN